MPAQHDAIGWLGSPQGLPRLQTRLLLWILAALVLVWGSFVFWAYQAGVQEADELTDGHLASVAALVLNMPLRQGAGAELAPTRRVTVPGLRAHDYQQSMDIQLWDAAGRLAMHVGAAPVVEFGAQREGFSQAALGHEGEVWRSFTQWDAERSHRVTVLVALQERDDLAEDIAGQMILPGLGLLPVVMLLLGLTIRTGLKPLQQLSADVERLDLAEGQRLRRADNWREFHAVTQAINTLLDRSEAAVEHERKLANEVAHELRTPLSSISLYAQALQGGLPAEEQAAAAQRIQADALRAGHVLQQILALARAGRVQMTQQAATVDLARLARDVAADYAQAAWQHGSSLSVELPEPLAVSGHALLLEMALRNLVENALRHTPRGTQIEVQGGRMGDGECWLQVCDDGGRDGAARPPEPVDSLHLGHEIVARVAQLHGGCFGPQAAPPPHTTCYRLTLPKGARAAHG